MGTQGGDSTEFWVLGRPAKLPTSTKKDREKRYQTSISPDTSILVFLVKNDSSEVLVFQVKKGEMHIHMSDTSLSNLLNEDRKIR